MSRLNVEPSCGVSHSCCSCHSVPTAQAHSASQDRFDVQHVSFADCSGRTKPCGCISAAIPTGDGTATASATCPAYDDPTNYAAQSSTASGFPLLGTHIRSLTTPFATLAILRDDERILFPDDLDRNLWSINAVPPAAITIAWASGHSETVVRLAPNGEARVMACLGESSTSADVEKSHYISGDVSRPTDMRTPGVSVATKRVPPDHALLVLTYYWP